MKELTIKEVEYIACELAQKLLRYDEPIPDFGTRFPNVLESCLVTPFQTFGRRALYRGLVSKAAIMFYLLIKNHPFQNGNKRIAMTTLFVFLYKNKKWLKVDNQQLYNFARWVAASDQQVRTETIAAIVKFLKTYMVEV